MPHYDVSVNIPALGRMGWSDVKDFQYRLDTTDGIEHKKIALEKDEFISVIVDEKNLVVRLRGDDGKDQGIIVHNMDYVLAWEVVV